MTRWEQGETIVLQDVWKGELWAAKPMTVAEDRGGFLALWMPKGTVWKVPTTPQTRPRSEDRGVRIAECMIRRDWVLADRQWAFSTLWLMEEGAGHAVWVSWHGTGEHWGWYINLQEPFRRVGRKVQTMDLALDITIQRDRTWRWKDDDELETLTSAGALPPAKAAEIRNEGEAVIKSLKPMSLRSVTLGRIGGRQWSGRIQSCQKIGKPSAISRPWHRQTYCKAEEQA